MMLAVVSWWIEGVWQRRFGGKVEVFENGAAGIALRDDRQDAHGTMRISQLMSIRPAQPAIITRNLQPPPPATRHLAPSLTLAPSC